MTSLEQETQHRKKDPHQIKSVFKSQETNDIFGFSRNNKMFRTMNSKVQDKRPPKHPIPKKLFLGNEGGLNKIGKDFSNQIQKLNLAGLNRGVRLTKRMKSARSRTPNQNYYSIRTDRQ